MHNNLMRLGFALATLLCTSAAFAQNSNSGDIRGTVTDPTGAVIPGANVSVLDVDKGTTTTYVTDSAGLYDTGSIVTDHYTITFTKEGFGTFVRGPVTLQVETLAINGTLKVGSSAETVTVDTDVPLLQTESGAQSTTFSEEALQDLPSPGVPSWENYVILVPGTSGSPTNSLSNVNPGQTASVNGNSVWYNVLGDGMSMSLPGNGNSYDYNFDTLSEVQMLTSGFSAQYESGGVIYNQISKGGTSHFHGDVFDYFQNSALNAASYAFGQGEVPVLRANYYGGSVGGPVPVGRLKGKLFFFFNYDVSQDYGGSASGFLTVPTAAMRTGDFTGQPTLYDPTSNVMVQTGTYTEPNGTVVNCPCLERQSFASEYGNGNKIPSSMIDAVATALQAYYPKPNVANPSVTNGITANNYFYNEPANSPGHALFWRTDYDVTKKNRLTITDFQSWGSAPNLGVGACPLDCNIANNSAITAQVSDVWTFSPDKINEFHFGLSTQNNLYMSETDNGGYPAKLGMQFSVANEFPTATVTGSCCWELQPGTNAIQHQLMLAPSDAVTIIKGKHVLHFGGEVLAQREDGTNWGNVQAGNLTFNGDYTEDTQGDPTTGLPYADFLLGYDNGWTAANTPSFGERIKTVQTFVQDDIKVLPNLTINAGVRWEGWLGVSSPNGNELSFDPTVINPATNVFGVANTLGGMWYGTTQANGRTKAIGDIWNTFLPRLAFSWQPKSNTVIRGGVGLYSYNFQGSSAFDVGSAFGSSGNVGDATNGIDPVLILNQNGTVNDQGSAGTSILAKYQAAPTDPDSYNGQSVDYTQYNPPVQKVIDYTLEIQRELGPNMVVNIAYVGNHGYNMEFDGDLNQVPESELGPNDASGTTNARPYPNFQAIGGIKWAGISNYNALQTTIDKRLSSGLQFNFNYTWSKYLDEFDGCAWNCATSVNQQSYDLRQSYGPADYDIRSMFKGRVVYKVPFGRGQRFLNNSAIADEIIGGWQASSTIVWQSGNPFTAQMQNGGDDYAQSGTQLPNVVPGVSPWSGVHHQIGPNLNWFNEAAFTAPAAGTFGDSGRNTLRGPDLSNINFSLGKNFTIWRERVFQLRADASNIFNHPSFGLANGSISAIPGTVNSGITSVTVGGRNVAIIGKISF
jgi:hypothetical protein